MIKQATGRDIKIKGNVLSLTPRFSEVEDGPTRMSNRFNGFRASAQRLTPLPRVKPLKRFPRFENVLPPH